MHQFITYQARMLVKYRESSYSVDTNYAQKGDGKSYFDYIDDFRSYIGSEKNSTELQKTLNAEKPPATVDVQLMLIPNLEKDVYDTALTKLVEKVQKTNGVIQESPYYLSDGTPVVRAIIPASTLTHYENDLAIYRIEETDFLMLTPLKTQ